MVDECIVVHALHLVGNDTAVGCHLASIALQKDVEPVAGVTVEECQIGVVKTAVPALLHENAVVAGAEQMRFFYLIEVEVRAVFHYDLNDLVRQETAL